ncbi:MAG: GvpL/GvpF family gas vesicle protein [Actinobacteria bacterium]|nr:GvpL/GvpF family gas vesicle protein [Actinomycetota bacterium]
MRSLEKDLIYLYCVTDGPPQLKETEDLVDNVYFIYHQGLYAVISEVSADEFSEENLREKLATLDWIKLKASVHEKLIEAVMKNSCVIPFKFGTLFNTEENLKTMLKEHMREFKDTLKYLEGKEEWGVKIYCDIDKLKENLTQENKELLSIDKEINSALPGKAFILKKKKEELVNIIVNKKLNEYGQDSFQRLKQHSTQFRVNKLLPKEVTERKDDMILNSVFLIRKDEVTDFVNRIDMLKKIHTRRGLSFDHTGPWPPYNFCLRKEIQNG